MSWLTEWKAISAQIQGLFEVSRFYFETHGVLRYGDAHSVGYLELVPHTNKIWDTLLKFRDSHRESVPSGAAESLDAALSRRTSFSSLKAGNAPEFLQVMVTVLASFRAEFEYHLSDASAVAMRLSERAFEHLQRSIVADDEFRRKWAEAFEKNEPACERLGAIHLLLHGIWAFKIDANGEKTDLVFNEPIRESSLLERAAEALVLTE